MKHRLLLISGLADQAVHRYPPRIDTGAEAVPLRVGDLDALADDQSLAGIIDHVDPSVLRVALTIGKPLLCDLGTLAALLDRDPDAEDDLSAGRWLPYLPLGLAPDVAAAAERLHGKRLGAPVSADLTTYIGSPPQHEWEPDAPWARTPLEALLFGLDLITVLLGQPTATNLLSGDLAEPGAVLVHHSALGGIATHRLLASGMAAGSAFRATVTCADGELMLRYPFAPSALTMWEEEAESFHCPALPQPKSNVQAPDTVRGGREAATLIRALLSDRRPRSEGIPGPGRALELLRHARANLPAPAWEEARGVSMRR